MLGDVDVLWFFAQSALFIIYFCTYRIFLIDSPWFSQFPEIKWRLSTLLNVNHISTNPFMPVYVSLNIYAHVLFWNPSEG